MENEKQFLLKQIGEEIIKKKVITDKIDMMINVLKKLEFDELEKRINNG